MISDWRTKFALPELAFLFVMLPGYVENLPSTLADGRVDASLPLLRRAQAEALSLPRVGMALGIDAPDLHAPAGSIHPRDKPPIAARLVVAARAVAAAVHVAKNDALWVPYRARGRQGAPRRPRL